MLTEMIFVTTNKSLAGLSNENVFLTLTTWNESNSYEGIDMLGKRLSCIFQINARYTSTVYNTFIEIL